MFIEQNIAGYQKKSSRKTAFFETKKDLWKKKEKHRIDMTYAAGIGYFLTFFWWFHLAFAKI